jgi:hypothetical protein
MVESVLFHVCFLASLAFAGCTPGRLQAQLRDGDIVFQTSRSSQSLAIQRATHSRYSHMGMIVLRNGEPFVFEASATVRYTAFGAWADRGEGGHYVVKRLREAAARITPAKVDTARALMRSFLGRS